MNIKFILRKFAKTILTMNIKVPKHSVYGELDIMIDSAKGIAFDKAVAGDYFMQLEKEIYAVSWHGYFENKSDKISFPTIHLKDSRSSYKQYKDLTHTGTVNSKEPFAFPICSLYIPQDTNWMESVKVSQYETTKIEYHFEDIISNINQRVDIFVTPKNVSADEILNSDLGYLYKMADVEMFNTKEGLFNVMNESLDKSGNGYNDYIKIHNLGNGHDLIVRTVGNQGLRYSELEGTYSLLVHDPNGAFNRMANRYVVRYDETTGKLEDTKIIKDELIKP